jgi:HNH endonuclease
MKFAFCVACLATDDLQNYHLGTREEGGGDEEVNLITLCSGCHNKLHQRQMNGAYNHSLRRGLDAARARGVKLGGYRHDGLNAKLPALERAEALRPVLEELAHLSHKAAAKALNERGITTARGKAWKPMQVARVRARLGATWS